MGENDIEDAEFEKVPEKKIDLTFWIMIIFILSYLAFGYYYLFSDY